MCATIWLGCTAVKADPACRTMCVSTEVLCSARPRFSQQLSPRAAKPTCGRMRCRPKRSRRALAPEPCAAMPAPAQGPHCTLATGNPCQQCRLHISARSALQISCITVKSSILFLGKSIDEHTSERTHQCTVCGRLGVKGSIGCCIIGLPCRSQQCCQGRIEQR